MSTLRYTQKLEEAGFNRRQAEEIVTIQQDAMNDTFATKIDFERMQLATKAEFQAVRAEMASEFQAVRTEIQTLEYRMTLKLGAMQVASVGVILAAFQYMR